MKTMRRAAIAAILLACAYASAAPKKGAKLPADGIAPTLEGVSLLTTSGDGDLAYFAAGTAKGYWGDAFVRLAVFVPEKTNEAKRIAKVRITNGNTGEVVFSQRVSLSSSARLGENGVSSPSGRIYRYIQVPFMGAGICAPIQVDVEVPTGDGDWAKSSKTWEFECDVYLPPGTYGD